MSNIVKRWIVGNLGLALQEGGAIDALLGLGGFNCQNSIVPTVGGTQTDSAKLTYGLNEVASSANDTDGVVLPPAAAGSIVVVHNSDSAQDVLVFGNGSDTINGTAGATGVALGQGLTGLYFCVTAGVWNAGVLTNTMN